MISGAERGSSFDPRSIALRSPDRLQDWEILAILFGTGTKGKDVASLSKELLAEFSSLSSLIFAPGPLLLKKTGLGRAKTALIAAVRELLYRVNTSDLLKESKVDFGKLQDILYQRTVSDTRESFYLISLGSSGCLLEIDLLAKGGLREVGIRFRDLLKTVLDTGAQHTILCHNHPGDTPEPSEEDWALFYSVKEFFLKLDIDLLDQWVMGRNGIYSCDKRKMIRKMK